MTVVLPSRLQYESNIDPDHYKRAADGPFINEVRARFAERFPALDASLTVGGFSGLYDVTPDWNPVLGPVDEVEGFYICAGFSGHGFKIGPAVGECLAELIVEGRASLVDLGIFDLKRFEDGRMLYGAYGGNRA